MNRIVLSLSLIVLGLTTVRCSSSDDSSAASSSFTGAYQALKSNLPGSQNSSSVLGLRATVSPLVAHADFADNDWPLVDGGAYSHSGAQYIASLVDESQEYSVLGRVKNSMMIACFLDLYGTKDAQRQVAVGSQTIKMKRSWSSSGCPGAAATMDYLFDNAPNVDSAGEIPLEMTVTDISADGVYQRKITMLGADNPQFGGGDQDMRLSVDGKDLVFSHDETSGPTQRSTSFLRYTASPELIQFQHTNMNTNVEQIYRFYINDTSNAAALFAFTGISGGAEITTVLASKANDLSQGTVSQTYTNYNGSVDGSDEEGCIDFDTSAFDANGFASCNGITGISSAASVAGIVTTFQGQSPNDLVLTNTFDKTFDETTITTQAVH